MIIYGSRFDVKNMLLFAVIMSEMGVRIAGSLRKMKDRKLVPGIESSLMGLCVII